MCQPMPTSSAGLAGAFALTRALRNDFYAVGPTDPITFAAVALLLVMVRSWPAWFPRAVRPTSINGGFANRVRESPKIGRAWKSRGTVTRAFCAAAASLKCGLEAPVSDLRRPLAKAPSHQSMNPGLDWLGRRDLDTSCFITCRREAFASGMRAWPARGIAPKATRGGINRSRHGSHS